MARGRKADPAEIAQAKGNPGKRDREPVATDALPAVAGDAPAELSDGGARIWRDLVPRLAHLKLARATDHAALARYCDTLAEYWRVTERLRDQDYTYEADKVGGGTMLRMNPLFSIQDRLGRRLVDLEDRFGLNPRARQEILYRMAQRPAAQGDLLPQQGADKGEGVEAETRPPLTGFLGGGAVH